MNQITPDVIQFIGTIQASLRGKVALEATSSTATTELECIDRTLDLLAVETTLGCDERIHLAKCLAHQLELALPLLVTHGFDLRAQSGAAEVLATLRTGTDPETVSALVATHVIPLLFELAGQGHANAGCLLAEFSAIENRFVALVAQRRDERRAQCARGAEDKRSSGPTQSLDIQALQHRLRQYDTTAPNLAVQRITYIPGGRSKETILVELSGAIELPPRVILRKDVSGGGLVISTASDEFPLLKTVHDFGGIPMPRPYICEPDPGVLGGSFLVVEAVSGHKAGEYFPETEGPAEHLEAYGVQLARILARVHQIGLRSLQHTKIDLNPDIRALNTRAIESTYQQALASNAPLGINVSLARNWLLAHMEDGDDDLVLVHCDVGLHNLMIEGPQITALLDWELACLGAPARDISKILHLIEFLMPFEDFKAAYLAAGGPPSAFDEKKLNYYAVMNYMVTSQRTRYARHLYRSGTGNTMVMANASYDKLYRTANLLAKSLAKVLG